MKVVKISATWCGPCKVFKPVFEKVSQELKDKVEFLEVTDEDDDLWEDYSQKYGIRTVPTTLILDNNGEVISKRMGAIPENVFREWILKYTTQ